MIRTPVVLEGRIAQGNLLGSTSRGKTANGATEENEHHRTAQHLVAHELYAWGCTDGDDSQSTGSMGIGRSEHKPHPMPVLAHRPSHYC